MPIRGLVGIIHAVRHQDGGADEVDIGGLAGSPAQKAAASGLASLNATSLVVQKPADRLGVVNLEWTANKLALGAGVGASPTERNPNTVGYDQGARVYHGVDQSISNITNTILSFDNERYDTDTIHDIVTNNSRLTCKTAGKYLIMSTVAFDTNATGRRKAWLLLNGVTVITMGTVLVLAATDWCVFSLGTIYDLAVNDYVEVLVYQDSGVALLVKLGAGSAEFMMQRIG